METLLITGANGSVGYEIIRQLHKIYRIIAIDKSFGNLTKYSDDIDCIEADICNKEALEPLFDGVDYVVHLAAKVHSTPKNEDDIEQFYKVNRDATETIFELCVKHKIKKVIYFSTIAVYGSKSGIINETTKTDPVTVYGKSKYEAEQIGLKMMRDYGLPLIILRPATMFGYLDRGNYKSLIKMAKKHIGVVPGGGLIYKPVIYVKDVAGIVKRILDSSITNDTFIICQNSYRYIDLLKDIEKTFEVRVFKLRIPLLCIKVLSRLLDIGVIRKLKTLSESIQLDNSKMIKVLGYYPEYDFYHGLKDSMNYYK